jgi:hypothetical protein
MLASIQQKLDLQLCSPPSPSLSSPSPQQPTASAPDAELSRRLDVQESLMDRMAHSIDLLARLVPNTIYNGDGLLLAAPSSASSSTACQ